MRKLLAALCLAVILVGSYTLKNTLDNMAWDKWSADMGETYTQVLQTTPPCSQVATFTKHVIFLPAGTCVWDLDSAAPDILVGAGSDETTVIPSPRNTLDLSSFHSIGGIAFDERNRFLQQR
jgi:hypothetical protein